VNWHIYRGEGPPHDDITRLPPPPPWRAFHAADAVTAPPVPEPDEDRARAQRYVPDEETVELVNAALYLRRPLLVTGNPGEGKSTLAYAIAHELGLGKVLTWPITSRATLRDGLYRYDPLSRLYVSSLAERQKTLEPEDPGAFIRLGPLGTALLPHERPRVLLVDEVDKSDIDLPNDLLTVFEEGRYEIPELVRLASDNQTVSVLTHDGYDRVPINGGRVRCRDFPLVVMTSNSEREFPAAFLRRCVQVVLKPPNAERLRAIVAAHLADLVDSSTDLIEVFLSHRSEGQLATDQLLNAIFLTNHAARVGAVDRQALANKLMRHLSAIPPQADAG